MIVPLVRAGIVTPGVAGRPAIMLVSSTPVFAAGTSVNASTKPLSGGAEKLNAQSSVDRRKREVSITRPSSVALRTPRQTT